MDFSNRNAQPQNVAPGVTSSASTSTASRKSNKDDSKLGRIGLVVAVVAVAILLLFLVLLVARSTTTSDNSDEHKLVDTSKLQAVFLSTGQVYFGNIQQLNNRYFVVNNIYYLQTSSTGTSTTAAAANTSVSLVKLGCELHSPYDKMVINRSQVTFWENLQDNGQVAQAVKTFKKQNPTGQKCSDSASSAPSTTNNVQGSTNTTTNSNTTTKP
ncbi:MAG: hypothetical protein JWM81_570 [Candidatus Saccharibacteria bacterium]|nr:hypothetical protein [Candidatus Saccharibacteria bacterium]